MRKALGGLVPPASLWQTPTPLPTPHLPPQDPGPPPFSPFSLGPLNRTALYPSAVTLTALLETLPPLKAPPLSLHVEPQSSLSPELLLKFLACFPATRYFLLGCNLGPTHLNPNPVPVPFPSNSSSGHSLLQIHMKSHCPRPPENALPHL